MGVSSQWEDDIRNEIGDRHLLILLRSLASENKSAAPMYREKIKQICERVERDFSDSHHFFSGWVNGKSILLESGYVVSLNGDRKYFPKKNPCAFP